MARKKKHIITCVCGSMKFWDDMLKVLREETLKGKIVLVPGVSRTVDEGRDDAVKHRLDALHLQKINMADEVVFVNRDGYLGESSLRELAYAIDQGKYVRPYFKEYSLPGLEDDEDMQ